MSAKAASRGYVNGGSKRSLMSSGSSFGSSHGAAALDHHGRRRVNRLVEEGMKG